MTPGALYLVGAMASWCPISDHSFHEAAAITEARYADIAASIDDVATDPDEPPLFPGPIGRVKTAVLLASIASFESGCFRTAVHLCNEGGDHARAWGLFQSHAGKDRVCRSLRDAATIALHQVRDSLVACADNTHETRLAGYTSGDCRKGWLAARNRWRRAREWSEEHPAPPSETVVIGHESEN